MVDRIIPTKIKTYSQIKSNIFIDLKNEFLNEKIRNEVLNKLVEIISHDLPTLNQEDIKKLTQEDIDRVKDDFYGFMTLLDQQMSKGLEEFNLPEKFECFKSILEPVQTLLTHRNTYNTCFTSKDTKLNFGFGMAKYGSRSQYCYSQVNFTNRAEKLIADLDKLNLYDFKCFVAKCKLPDEFRLENFEPIDLTNSPYVGKDELIKEYNLQVESLNELQEYLHQYKNVQDGLSPTLVKNDKFKNEKNDSKVLFDVILDKKQKIETYENRIIYLQEQIKINLAEINREDIPSQPSTLTNLLAVPQLLLSTGCNFAFSLACTISAPFAYVLNSTMGWSVAAPASSNNIVTIEPEPVIEHVSTQVIEQQVPEAVISAPAVEQFIPTSKEQRRETRAALIEKLENMYAHLEDESNKITNNENKKRFIQSISFLQALINGLKFLNPSQSWDPRNPESFVQKTAALNTSRSNSESAEFQASLLELITGNKNDDTKACCFTTPEEQKLRGLILSKMQEVLENLTDINSQFHLMNLFNIDNKTYMPFPKALEMAFMGACNKKDDSYIKNKTIEVKFNNIIFSLYRDIYINRKGWNFNKIADHIKKYESKIEDLIKQDIVRVIVLTCVMIFNDPNSFDEEYIKGNKDLLEKILIEYWNPENSNNIADRRNIAVTFLIDKIAKESETLSNLTDYIKIRDVFLEVSESILNRDSNLMKKINHFFPYSKINAEDLNKPILFKGFMRSKIQHMLKKHNVEFIGMIASYAKILNNFANIKNTLLDNKQNLEPQFFEGKVFKSFFTHYADVVKSSDQYIEIEQQLKLIEIEKNQVVNTNPPFQNAEISNRDSDEEKEMTVASDSDSASDVEMSSHTGFASASEISSDSDSASDGMEIMNDSEDSDIDSDSEETFDDAYTYNGSDVDSDSEETFYDFSSESLREPAQ